MVKRIIAYIDVIYSGPPPEYSISLPHMAGSTVDSIFAYRELDEETGWYDGQIWVKTPEVLARDRLLGSFSVKPVLNRVKITLIGLAVALVTCAILFINIENLRDSSEDSGGRAIAGAYKDESARLFEPDAFCGEPDLS
ncbi:uncharacterized protein A4U43_C03F29970 [Asparagus officinalis]|uniref:Uncharacterized protein n=1 Tax=Asparagus officinalis TaxID=4686 RepID=A0A5P1FE09_ASPOF|nr:uncharacterized protein A4U43_C03F29970 [Asparagus officinalis]